MDYQEVGANLIESGVNSALDELYVHDQYLFEITDPSLELNIDVRVEKGYKYYSVDFLRNRDIEEENNEVILKIENLYNSDSQSNWGEEVEYEVPDSGLGIFKLGSVSCISVDDNNVIWIGTHNGLYKFYKKKFLRFGTKVGMPSVWINDIAIRNTGIRYIATSDGIAKMMVLIFLQ